MDTHYQHRTKPRFIYDWSLSHRKEQDNNLNQRWKELH